MMTTASKITLIRIAMIPVFFIFMLLPPTFGNRVTALVIFALASTTDWLDGYIARKYNQVTNFGKFIDPLADKLLVTGALLIFVQEGQMPSWCAMLIITREFAVTGLRLVAVEGGKVIAAAASGKIKTFSSIIAICVMLTPLYVLEPFSGVTVNDLCVAVMTITTLYSGVEYFVKNKSVFNVDSNKHG